MGAGVGGRRNNRGCLQLTAGFTADMESCRCGLDRREPVEVGEGSSTFLSFCEATA